MQVDFSKYKWQAPKATDLRSPCPGLNTLANHGILPRNGRGLTVKNLVDASIIGYNVQIDVIALPAKVGFLTSDNDESFTLADIRLHNNIEHDASVSRADFFTGDNFSFNETLFSAMINVNPGLDYYDPTSAGIVQKQRLSESQATNPTLINTVKEFTIRTRESSLYLSVMGNATTGVAPKKFVNIFFREERLPIAEGWKRSPIPITGDSLNPIMDVIATASDWTADDKCSSVVFVISGNDTFTV
ncbi:Cloroperoxidase [Mycena floridula]|nr:Cloroperoxidase [Mycena floridula]